MDFIKERKRLDNLKKNDVRQYLEELKNPWPGMEEDINLLEMMLLKPECEQKMDQGKPSKRIEGFQILRDQVSIQMSVWAKFSLEEFRAESGHDEGHLRYLKAMAVFLERQF